MQINQALILIGTVGKLQATRQLPAPQDTGESNKMKDSVMLAAGAGSATGVRSSLADLLTD
jgi:hypothetical protein